MELVQKRAELTDMIDKMTEMGVPKDAVDLGEGTAREAAQAYSEPASSGHGTPVGGSIAHPTPSTARKPTCARRRIWNWDRKWPRERRNGRRN